MEVESSICVPAMLLRNLLNDNTFEEHMAEAERYIPSLRSKKQRVYIEVMLAYRKDDYPRMKNLIKFNPFPKSARKVMEQFYIRGLNKLSQQNNQQLLSPEALKAELEFKSSSVDPAEALWDAEFYNRKPRTNMNYELLAALPSRTITEVKKYMNKKQHEEQRRRNDKVIQQFIVEFEKYKDESSGNQNVVSSSTSVVALNSRKRRAQASGSRSSLENAPNHGRRRASGFQLAQEVGQRYEEGAYGAYDVYPVPCGPFLEPPRYSPFDEFVPEARAPVDFFPGSLGNAPYQQDEQFVQQRNGNRIPIEDYPPLPSGFLEGPPRREVKMRPVEVDDSVKIVYASFGDPSAKCKPKKVAKSRMVHRQIKESIQEEPASHSPPPVPLSVPANPPESAPLSTPPAPVLEQPAPLQDGALNWVANYEEVPMVKEEEEDIKRALGSARRGRMTEPHRMLAAPIREESAPRPVLEDPRPPRFSEDYTKWTVEEMANWVMDVTNSPATRDIVRANDINGSLMKIFQTDEKHGLLKILVGPWVKLQDAARRLMGV